MTTINALPNTSVQAQAFAAEKAAQDPAPSSQSGTAQASEPALGNSFGSAVNVTLSPAGQAVVSQNPPPPPANGGSAGAAPPAAGKSPGGHVPVTTSSTTSDTATLVEEAKQQVIPQVGVTGAGEVVDNKGNIDETKLHQLVQQQAQPASNG